VLDACSHGLALAVCDGVDDCIRIIRLQLRKGAKFIKACTSGGVFSEIDSVLDAQFSPEELKVMLDEAAGARRAVAAHCHAKEGIMNALNTGVKTIEHGSYLGEECVPLMKQKDVFVVTASVIEGGHEIRGRAASKTGGKTQPSCCPQQEGIQTCYPERRQDRYWHGSSYECR
jgi:imidazolonepropionase-like amidohydrolase